MGVWIETTTTLRVSTDLTTSPPMWGCGLKHVLDAWQNKGAPVTPHVGVWIETSVSARLLGALKVTPHVGVWIET